ncbi:molecular chaperone DnaJ [Serpentinicella sp. ANB-PHB4]|uniref:molecular chaperone DnaJ n=1 Tax=Serpentinicella sp. ANB-PHB4 TaxID=3074076 RepID=UPI002862AB2C|nr:molecular chaperone DnaJ [Serpentinicella sp. ANB-PHB4]MDR5657971.1 molecular chaperone DnaJ [Serpentinicella sp. ANB-PHB4]
MSKRDFYEVLGVDRNAAPDEIKRAYRKLAMKYHPDKNKGDQTAETKFKEINEAYEVLGDQEKKQRYDQFGHAGVNGNGASGFEGFGGGGFEDIFGDIFDIFGGGGFSSSRRQRGPRKGADVKYEQSITFEEAAFGVEKTIKFHKEEDCKDCNGSGAASGSTSKTCPDCNGKGEVRFAQRTPLGQIVNVRPCTKCAGEGKIIEKPCPKCNGKGTERKLKSIKVKIPAGVDTGSVISIRGEGELGQQGGPPGDLYVVINVMPHKIFERDGLNVYCEIPITFAQAVLGDELEVPTLEGRVKYKIPEGTQTGTIFRLKSKGISSPRNYGKGDQFVKVVVEVPKKLTEKQKDIIKQFASEGGEDIHEQRKTFFDKVKDVFGV